MSVLVESAGPVVSVQDGGRRGALGLGLSRGGAADREGWLAGVALLEQGEQAAAIEMAGIGGRFQFECDMRIALTGALMRTRLNNVPLEWNAAHVVPAGGVLDIGVAEQGTYGYLALAGGIDTEVELGGRGFHKIAGLGRAVEAGDRLRVLPDAGFEKGPQRLMPRPAPNGPIRVMPGPQTDLFAPETRRLFETLTFQRSPKANRQGARLDYDGPAFSTEAQLNQVSDFISEGDIQMTGGGTPYVLLADCQSMGGYPRIGTVLPSDLSRVAQAGIGERLSFRFVTCEEAEAAWESDADILARLRKRCGPAVRDPREIADLLSYELVSRPVGDVTG